MRYDEGYKLHVGALSPSYVETAMSSTTFDSTLSGIYIETWDERGQEGPAPAPEVLHEARSHPVRWSDRLVFLRLNRLFIPEVKALHDAIEANKAAAARCKEKVAQVGGAMANTALVLNL